MKIEILKMLDMEKQSLRLYIFVVSNYIHILS